MVCIETKSIIIFSLPEEYREYFPINYQCRSPSHLCFDALIYIFQTLAIIDALVLYLILSQISHGPECCGMVRFCFEV